ncbi:prenyltransferase [Thermococcus sp.]
MLVKEILSSVEVIPDPYVKSVTYAKIGERLAKAKNKVYKVAFLKAMETAKSIEDPATMFRALLSVGYSMGRAGLKSSKRVYSHVMEDSRILPKPQRDVIMRLASLYMLALGEINEAITYALEITNPTMRDEVLLTIIRVNTRMIEREKVKVAYRLRKSRLALDYMISEPQRSKAILEVIKAHIALGSYETAVSYLSAIGDPDWARQGFKEVLFRLRYRDVLGHLLEPLEGAAKVLIERFGSDFQYNLAFAFALVGEGEEAVKLLRQLGDPELMTKMALKLLELDNNALPSFIGALNEEEAEIVGKAVMNAILEKPELGNDDIVGAVGKSTSSEEVWAKISRYYVIRGELEAAMKIARLIKSPELRSLIMADLSHQLLKRGEVESAIDAALEVKDERFASILVAEILISALEKELEGKVRLWNGSGKS